MATKAKNEIYYEKYRSVLEKIRENNVNILDEGQLTIDSSAKRKQDNLQFIEQNLKVPLRYYQKESLFVFEDLAYYTSNNIPYKEELLEDVNDDKVGFYTFEMATGSGKTLLMGATILDIYRNMGIKDFLIISPNTTLNEKTVGNFQVPQFSSKSVWNNNISLNINVITSENYQQQQDIFYHQDADINLYIFNISKFFENGGQVSSELMKGMPYVKREIETAIWKDEAGNSISFMKYLKNNRLAIITDEAHHYQSMSIEGVQGNKSSFEVIKELKPEIVLEFTATAIENVINKRMQKIIYKYSIKDFIEDGYSKRIRALGMKNENNDLADDELSNFEKQKIIIGMLIHLIKKKSLNGAVKPLLFIKCRADKNYENKVYDYIKNFLLKDEQNIADVIEKIKIEYTTMTALIRQFLEDINYDFDEIKRNLMPLCNWTLLYDGETKDNKITKSLYNNIETNEIETVVYMKILDEGIDFNNIYTIVVLHDAQSNIKTNVKQIIGRGVRLFRNKRLYDTSSNLLKQQSELLYIVCDKDKNFEKVIEEIRQEIGLGKDSLSFDGIPQDITNKIKSDIIKDKELPFVKAKVIKIPEVDFPLEIQKVKDIVDSYLESDNNIVTVINGKYVLRNLPGSLISEGEVYSDDVSKKIEEKAGKQVLFKFDNNIGKKIHTRIVNSKRLPILPSNPMVINLFDQYINEIKSRELYYNYIEELDMKFAKNYFISTFVYFYINYINKRLFTYDYETDYVFKLSDIFNEYNIKLNKGEDGSYTNLISKELVESESLSFSKKDIKSIYIYGYNNSIYEYNNFDSNPERYMADFLDNLLDRNGDKQDFWIRNQRNYYLQYRMNRFFPDFILYYKNMYYIIEVKGENLLDEFMDEKKKLGALKKLNEFKNIKCFVIKGNDVEIIKKNCGSIDDLEHYNQINKV